ncbi:Phosphotransferase enzyme [Didymosphaeria variabile]|uniref:Phosphotransferase enzyme n=1 Tax=Didymosphaeria variabile TaxID=1932322 RepID=A0A9W8XVZ9_9PLEO|nr:Phosphotransferase enzyme [Didymosphaeria variabile]KAJ4360729.1 Phosphotransferase enzyme [Didymosphaeria variabile]
MVHSRPQVATLWSPVRCHAPRRSLYESAYAPNKFDHEHFYQHSTGRWLWDEKKQLAESYRHFDIPALKEIAAQSVGAKRCISMGKIAEGHSSRVFRLRMDNGKYAFARILYANLDPECAARAINSEVASMEFARTVLGVPTPRVLDWSGTQENAVGAEYVLMEAATGTPLWRLWPKMDVKSKLSVVAELIEVEKKFLSVAFTRYGNLYIAQDAFPGCEKAEVKGQVAQLIKDEVSRRFVIGPVAARSFWHHERACMEIDRGPWKSPQDYLRAIARREIAWTVRHADPKTQRSFYNAPFTMPEPPMQRDISKHIAHYLKLQDLSETLLPEGEKSRATLWHPNLRTANIFVKDNKITGIIDWNDVWVGPLFLQAESPSLVTHVGEMKLKLPDENETMDEVDQGFARRQVDGSMVAQAYREMLRKQSPFLSCVRNVPHAKNTQLVIHLAQNTWHGDVVLLRQVLIRVARHWGDMRPDIPCPISFTDAELEELQPYAEGWNHTADIYEAFHTFMGVHRDGWIEERNYEVAVEYLKEIIEKIDYGEEDTPEEREDFMAKLGRVGGE